MFYITPVLQEWKVMGKSAGLVREAGPLSFVRVYKAGHMVGALDVSWLCSSGSRLQEPTCDLRLPVVAHFWDWSDLSEVEPIL
jgi:hypothetical protein